jgi:hypothetical protein
MLNFVFCIYVNATWVRTLDYIAASKDDVVWTSVGVTDLQVG